MRSSRMVISIQKKVRINPQGVGDLHLTFSGVSVEELQRILGGKGSVFNSKNKDEILVCGYSE